MGYCENCGKELADNSNFCPNCGTATSIGATQKEPAPSPNGTIIFRREKSAAAKAVKTKIIINGHLYGTLKENEELKVHLPFGCYNIELKTSLNPSSYSQIIIDNNNFDIMYPFKIGFNGKPSYCGDNYNTNINTKAPKKKIGCLSTLLIVIILIAIMAFVGSLSAENEDVPSASEKIEAVNTPPSPEPSFTTITGTVGNWEVTVNDFEFLQNVSAGLLHEYSAKDGSQYCIINITAKNIGTEAATFLPYIYWDNDAVVKIKWNEYEYTRSDLLFSNDNLSSEDLNPLVSASGDIAFELPNEVINSDIPPILIFKAGNESFTCELAKN